MFDSRIFESANYAKQGLDWHTEPLPGLPLYRVSVITPAGHTYLSTAPPLPLPRTDLRADRQNPARPRESSLS